MRVTLTNDLGETVVANDIKEAKRIEARMKREEAKRRKHEEECYSLAKLRASAGAMDMVAASYANPELPKGWTYYPAGVDYAEAVVAYDDEQGGCYLTVRVFADGDLQTVRKEWYSRDTLVGFVANSAGCIAIVVRWHGAESETFHAVGVNRGVLAMTEIPAGVGITVDRFRKSKRAG